MLIKEDFSEVKEGNIFLLELEPELEEYLKVNDSIELRRDRTTDNSYLVTEDSTYLLLKNELANSLLLTKKVKNEGNEAFAMQSLTKFKILAKKSKPMLTHLLEDLSSLSLTAFKRSALLTIPQLLERHVISKSELIQVR